MLREVSREIVHYDLANLNASGYHLAGLHAHAATGAFRLRISKRAPRDLFARDTWNSSLDFVSLFRARDGTDAFYFCIDQRDNRNHCHVPYLRCCRYYFKVNYDAAALAANPDIAHLLDRVRPIRPFFPLAVPRFAHRPRLLPAGRAGWGPTQVSHRLGHLRTLGPLERLTALRGSAPVRDVAFVVPFYGRGAHAVHNEYRFEVMRSLEAHSEIDAYVGFVGTSVEDKFARYHIPRVPFQEHITRVARSRVAVYVRGLHDCISYKFGELLALGLPIAGQPIINNHDAIMAHPDIARQFAYEDPSALVAGIAQMLAAPDECAVLGDANARLFDSRFSPARAVEDVLQTIWADA